MPDPARLRDSTEILLPASAFEQVGDELEERFTVTVQEQDDRRVRIIGSPVEIKDATDFLARNGVSID